VYKFKEQQIAPTTDALTEQQRADLMMEQLFPSYDADYHGMSQPKLI